MSDAAARVLVVGVGHRDRGDDGAGPALADGVAALAPPGVDTLVTEGDLVGLLDAWAGCTRVVVVDATASGAPTGTVRELDPAGPFRHATATSSHGFGLAETLALARALGRLPPEVRLLGIEGACYDVGAPLSEAVAAAAQSLALRLALEEAAADGR